MTISSPSWDGNNGCSSKHDVFVLYDTADKFEGLVAIVLLGRDLRLVEDRAYQIGRRRLLEIGDEMACGLKPCLTFRFVTNVSGLQREVDPPSGAVYLVWRHDLLAEQEACLGGQFDARSCAEPDRSAVHDHHFALAQLQNEIRHSMPSAEQMRFKRQADEPEVWLAGFRTMIT
jgi:hypothetical protein